MLFHGRDLSSSLTHSTVFDWLTTSQRQREKEKGWRRGKKVLRRLPREGDVLTAVPWLNSELLLA